MCRAASAAKRIISTAPMAKFGRDEHVGAGAPLSVVELGQREAGRPDHHVHAGGDRLVGVGAPPCRGREVDQHLRPGGERLGHVHAERRVGAGHQLHVRRRRPPRRPSAPIRPAAPATATPPVTTGAPPHQRRLDRRQRRARSGSVGTDPGGGEPLGRPQLVGQLGQVLERRPRRSGPRPRRACISGSPARISEPSRFMRAPVDSSASTTRPLRFSLARSQLLGGRRALA